MLVSLSPPKEAEVEEPEAQAEDAQEDNELPEEISDHDDDDDDISGSNSEDDMILASQMPKKDEGYVTLGDKLPEHLEDSQLPFSEDEDEPHPPLSLKDSNAVDPGCDAEDKESEAPSSTPGISGPGSGMSEKNKKHKPKKSKCPRPSFELHKACLCCFSNILI